MKVQNFFFWKKKKSLKLLNTNFDENGSMKPPAKNSTGVANNAQKKKGFGRGGFLFLIKVFLI